MKKTNKVILVSLLSVSLFGLVGVSANEYDFYESTTVSDKDLTEEILKEQTLSAEKFNETLDECTYLDYTSKIVTNELLLEAVTFETSDEKNQEVAKYEEDGYTTIVKVTYDEAVKTAYEFAVLNGKVTGATIDSVATDTYNGMEITSVLSGFSSNETDDYNILVTTSNDSNVVIDEEVIKNTKREALDLVSELEEQGYEATYVQNNTEEVTSDTLVYEEEMSRENIISEIVSSNSKDVLDVIISDATEVAKDEFTSRIFSDYDDALTEQNRLNGIYDVVSEINTITETIQEEVVSGSEKVASDVEVPSVDFDITSDENVKVDTENGYRIYKLVEDVEVSSADSVEFNFLTETECENKKVQYEALGYKNLTCTEVTTSTIEKSEDDTYIFNDTVQDTEMSWVHLDISVEQEINLYNEDGSLKETVVATITEAPKAWLNKGTNKEVSITYNSESSTDGDRYEYRSSTDSSFKHTDYVTLEFKVTYTTSDKVVHNATITLEGYLKNTFNVCKDKNSSHNRGFDVEMSISVLADGDEVVNITTNTVYTFTAIKDAVIEDKIYYDEYEYIYETVDKDIYTYYVEAYNVDYSYLVSYIVTDYTVSYDGSSSVYNVTVENSDKNYVVEGNKITYTVTTIGEIKDNDTCGIGTGDDEEPVIEEDKKEEVEVIPPKTGVNGSDNVNIPNILVTVIEDKKRRIF